MERIPFNQPFFIGNEINYIKEAVKTGRISGHSTFTKKCHHFFEEHFGFRKTLLTTSCTDALEMAALLTDIKEGDEVIMPSFTFVSTANAFVLRGARIVFVDSENTTPNLDAESIEPLITPKTKAIVPVHYAGISCDMDKINNIAHRHNLYVIEDAAQAIDSYYKGRVLGSLGQLAAFSFHETKNVISGEGGMLVVNNEKFIERSEIIWEKGTNRQAFFRGEVDKYGWVDVGSSFLPSDIVAAFLYAQLENLDKIQSKRKVIWYTYHELLRPLAEKEWFRLPHIPQYASNNAHLFYIVCRSGEERQQLIQFLRKHNIISVFHYLPLHLSPFYKEKHDGRELKNAVMYSECLLRLPLFYELTEEKIAFVCEKIDEFYTKNTTE